ncbi:TPM domain-containing protein [Chitinibacter fontanus]|uniref:TPM domain-containing protein n=1 Tax=Chitinibacter fontanus TaxID=1737446 RepID=A0A7D5Z4H5_9NEIS|nr:TPM domain-containing protein [Chitinibacter fontanus]QLI81003.1 TPM domain-containing protein [Chitinibacter fontanus]
MHTNFARCWQQLQLNPFRSSLRDPALIRRLSQTIAQAEAGHRGEIRLVIEARLPLKQAWQGQTARQRAVQWFTDLHVWDTECNTGMVLYLLLAERKIELVADRGIAARVPQTQWDEICQRLQSDLALTQIEVGLATAITTLGQLLQQHFPLETAQINPNELDNTPVIVP